jgi:hypothetical protein
MSKRNAEQARLVEDEVDRIVCDPLPGELSQEKIVKLNPMMAALEKAVLDLSRKYTLGLKERMLLRQRLVIWLGDKLERNEDFPLEVAIMGFGMYGERFAREILSETENDLTADIDATWDDVSDR